MDHINWAAVASRWLHIVGAIIAVGGAIFIRAIVLPSTRSLPADTAQTIRDAFRKRWSMIYGICIVVLLASGLYNYLVVAVPQHRGQGLYNALIGVKIILAFAVFFLGSALVGRSPAFENLRRNAPRWLIINIGLALIVVAIATVLKFIPTVAGAQAGS
jgi:uncharacterized membrane protein